jgi:hypothetical protein
MLRRGARTELQRGRVRAARELTGAKPMPPPDADLVNQHPALAAGLRRRNAMTSIQTPPTIDGVPTYLEGGDPAGRFDDYYPAWLDNLADDVTVEGTLLDGAVQGAEAVRSVIVAIRSLYDRQDFNFAGPWGDCGFIENYVARVQGEPIACLGLITHNEAGKTQHIAANYRPLSSALLLSRLVGEKFAGTAIGEHFGASAL